jgi:hypothetical protein
MFEMGRVGVPEPCTVRGVRVDRSHPGGEHLLAFVREALRVHHQTRQEIDEQRWFAGR